MAAGVFAVPDPTSGDRVMAALEVPEGVTFDSLDLPGFPAAQADTGTKGAPRFVRFSHALPTTGSNKLQKKAIQLEGWRTTDPVHRWEGRGAPSYVPMADADKAALRAEFEAAGRLRFPALTGPRQHRGPPWTCARPPPSNSSARSCAPTSPRCFLTTYGDVSARKASVACVSARS
ncbi:hypothetical protein LP418_26945 [Nocardioides sp. B-3]|nr:hypothetical protein LP418_26945 [Nocardioides sp. B-3]